MQASPCELESWDSATKLCYVLFANIPFRVRLRGWTRSPSAGAAPPAVPKWQVSFSFFSFNQIESGDSQIGLSDCRRRRGISRFSSG